MGTPSTFTTLGGPSAQRGVLFLHGILGSRSNWRSVARQVVARRPELGAVLVDLHAHGAARGAPSPHTVAATARDLMGVDPHLEFPIAAVVGHSFGGKTALEWAALAAHKPRIVFSIDSPPGPLEPGELDRTEAASVIAMLRTLPGSFADREEFVRQVVQNGYSSAIGQWLAMNLMRDEGGQFRFAIDLAAIDALLRDYARRDLWPIVDDLRGSTSFHFVVGGRSTALSDHELSRVQDAAEERDYVSLTRVPEAGHWVHVDAPDAVVDLLEDRLGSMKEAEAAEH